MSLTDKNYLGLDGCIFWFGIVESRQDPLGLGRVQVRIYGWHNQSLSEIPTDNLPWASVMFAVNDRGFGAPREDDLVFGIFTDGRNAQMPLVMGIVPGYFTNNPNTGQGFNDLRSQKTLVNAPKHPVARSYNTDGSGITLTEANTADPATLESFRHPNADELDQNSITGVARYENLANTVIQARKSNLDKNILSANNFKWSEPYPAYNPLYPYNQANETESGHVFELDDTPLNERIHIAHRSGSYVEWFPTGTKVEKVTKSNYQIVMADDYLHVMGKVAITVDGDCLVRCNGDVIIEGGGKFTANVAGDMDFSVGGNFNVLAQAINMQAQADASIISETMHLSASAEIDVLGETTNLGSSGDINVVGSGTATIQGSIISLSGEVLADSISPGATPGTQAVSGTPTGIGAALGALVKNTGEAPPEEVPVPIPGPFLPDFDPVTGTAYKQQLFLANTANNTLVPPDSNVSNANTANCNFDPTSHMFISDSTTWAIDQNGLNIIQQFEGFANVVSPNMVTAYPDPATGGEPLTIGYGSTAVGIGQPVTLGEIISRETAQNYLQDSINSEFLPTLQKTITVPITQNMIDACLSLIYNIGPNNFTKSSVRKFINQQMWCQAANAFLLWNKAAGQVLPSLTKRRQAERTLFLT
jgi:lysozyme